MKNEQHAQAHNLYFQTDLTKAEIAKLLNISRQTLHTWAKEGSWDNLRKSAKHMPAILAEQCYFIIGHLTQSLLSESRSLDPVTSKEAETLHKLVLTINKLKNRTTANENIELFSFFVDGLKDCEPELASQVFPHIENFLASRSASDNKNYAPRELNASGRIPYKSPRQQEIDAQEAELDRQCEEVYQEQLRQQALQNEQQAA